VKEYNSGQDWIAVNDTDCVVCNYGASGHASDYIPSNLPGQCIGLDQCGTTINETISMASVSLVSEGEEDKGFDSRMMDRILSSGTFAGSSIGQSSDQWGDMEELMKKLESQVSIIEALIK